MPDYQSDQLANRDAVPQVRNHPAESGGRKRTRHFTFTVPTGDVAVDKTIELGRIPKGAIILGGFFDAEAMSTAGGTAQVQLGDGTTADKYKGTTSVDAASQFDFANTIGLNYGEQLTAELVLTATVKGEAWAATKKIAGDIDYLHD